MKIYKKYLASLILLFSVPLVSSAATLEVSSTADTPATPLACTGGPSVYSCPTLRDAMNAANTLSGADVINFNGINKLTDPNCAMNDGDIICKIKISPSALLPKITSSLEINGAIPESRLNIPGSVSNPSIAATLRPGIEISEELLPSAGSPTRAILWIQGTSGVTIKGLILTNAVGPMIFANNSSNITIQGNYLGTDASGKAVSVWGPGFTACLSNCFGTRNAQSQEMLLIGVSNVLVGGNGNSERNVVANSFNTGITLSDITNSAVIGNLIGTDVLGLAKAGSRNEGLEIRGFTPDVRFQLGTGIQPLSGMGVLSDNNRFENNVVIDSKLRSNVRLLGREYNYKTSATATPFVVTIPVNHTTIIGNIIGYTLAGVSAPSVQSSMSISDATNGSTIGFEVVNGKVVPKPNKINSAVFYGIGVTESARTNTYTFTGLGASGHTVVTTLPGIPIYSINHAILYNMIDGTGLLPIDLTANAAFNGDGVKVNDNGDLDVGSNNYQNYPVLDNLRSFRNPAMVKVEGSLNSLPNTTFLIQFYSNGTAKCLSVPGTLSTPMSSGCNNPAFPFLAAQANTFIGETVVTTDSNGNASSRANAKEGVPVGDIINATATRMDVVGGKLIPMETSEFSEAVDVDQKGSPRAYEVANGSAGGDAEPQD